ncbi:MAG: hypothetical protein RL410_1585 [Actinomycetota bacterium]
MSFSSRSARGFLGNVAAHRCVYGSNEVLVSSTVGTDTIALATPITSGGSLQFEADSRTVTSATVSIAVDLQ